MTHDYSAIEGMKSLTRIYGDALCFHDSEVVRLELIRGRDELGEASLLVDIHLFQVERLDRDTNRFVLGNHHVARLRFDEIQELELSGFNHQNALMDLAVVRLEPPQNGAGLRVTLQPAFGLGATFNCSRASLVSVSAGKPERNASA